MNKVTPKIIIRQKDFESLNETSIYYAFLDENDTSIRLEILDYNYVITVYYNGYIYQVYTFDILEINNCKQLNNIVNNILLHEDINTDTIYDYDVSYDTIHRDDYREEQTAIVTFPVESLEETQWHKEDTSDPCPVEHAYEAAHIGSRKEILH